MPDLSVVLPTYNRIGFIDNAVASVLAQNDVDFELLIVDDHSTDGTAEHLAVKYGDEARVRLLRTPVNGGPSAAKNYGISCARAPLVTILCDDDAFRPGALEAACSLMDENPHIGFAWFGIAKYEGIFDDEHFISEKISSIPCVKDKAMRELLWARHSPGDGYLLIVRKEFLTSVGLYSADMRAGGDIDLLLRLMRRYEYIADDRVFVNVRLHSSGQTVRNPQLRAVMHRHLLDRHREALKDAPQAYAIWLERAAIWSFRAGDAAQSRRLIFGAIRRAPLSYRLWRRWLAMERSLWQRKWVVAT